MIRAAAVEACVALGFFALALLGGPWLVASALAWGMAVAARAVGPRVGARRASLSLPLVVGLVAAGVAGALSLESAVIAGLASLQIQRRLARRGPEDDRVAVVVAGLMLVVTAGRTHDAAFLALALGWAVALPLALLPPGRACVPKAPHLAVLGVGHLSTSLALFVLLPRISSPSPVAPRQPKLVGFAPDVELGSLAPLLEDPTVVFRAEVVGEALREPVYWRGIALDGFDGTRWYSSTPPVPGGTQAPGGGARVRVTPTGPSDGVLFVPGPVQHVEEAEGVLADAQGGWFVPVEASGRPYVVQVTPRGRGEAWSSEPDPDVGRWLALPALDPGVVALASRVAGEGSAAERARRLASWLASEVVYTRRAGDHGARPLRSFLLDRREGHCEYVAAGLVVLLRSEGIPARVVNGFLGGEVDPLRGEWVVRRHHAHSWTEALLDGRWVLLDATPAAAPVPTTAPSRQLWDAAGAWWEQEVVGYDRDRQRGALRRLAEGVRRWGRRPLQAIGLLGVLVGALGWAGWVARRWWRRRLPGVERAVPGGLSGPLQRAERALASAGLSPPPSAPPVEVARWLRGRAPDGVAEAFEALAWLHYDVVFGGVPAAQVRGRARDLADRVVEAIDADGAAPR